MAVYEKIMRVMDSGSVSLENGTNVMYRQTRTPQTSRERFGLSKALPSSTSEIVGSSLAKNSHIELAFNGARISATIIPPFGLKHFELCG